GVCPLPGFMAQAEAAELDRPGPPPAGAAWPVPVTLTVPETLADVRELVLADPEGAPLAELTVTESFRDGTVRLAGPIRPAAPLPACHRGRRAVRAGRAPTAAGCCHRPAAPPPGPRPDPGRPRHPGRRRPAGPRRHAA